MYEFEPVLRVKKDGKVVLTAEDAERLLKADSTEQSELLAEYKLKSSVFNDKLKNMYRNPVPTVDGIILHNGKLVLIKRGSDPYAGYYALPGGFIEYGESAEDAVVREIAEETGLQTEVSHFVGVYSNPDRDPRQHTITTAFFLHVIGGDLEAGDDASDVACFPLDSLPALAFDHKKIIEDWQERFKCQDSGSQAPESL